MRMKQWLIFAAALCLLTLSLPGHTLTAQDSPTELVLPLIGFATELPGWQAAIDEANKILAPKNIHIKTQTVTATTWDEYYQKITAQLAAGQPLDIGRIAESQMPQVISREQAVDLTDYISKDIDPNKYFMETFKNAAYQDGHYYGIPSGVYYMLLYYNKDLFDKAGLAYPSSDWNNSITMDQTREDAKKLSTGEGTSKIWGFAGGPYMAFIGMYAVSAGGKNVFHDDGTCALTDPESVAAYEWFDGMLRDDKTQPRPTDTKVISSWDMFKAGRLAMTVDGTWFLTDAKAIKNFKVGIAAVPSATGKAYSSQFVDSWVIWKGTQREAEAWEALKAIYSTEAFTALSEKGVGGIPISRDVLQSRQDELLGAQFTADDKAAFVSALDHTLGVPYNEHYAEADTKINTAMDEWLLGNISAADFAAKACGIVEKVMDQ